MKQINVKKLLLPKQYEFCIHKLGCGKVLDFLGVPYAPNGGESP